MLARSLAIAALVMLACPSAHAADFSEDGTFLFDPAAAAVLDFEEDIFPEEGGRTSLTVEDEDALSGARVLTLGQFEGIDRPVEGLPNGARLYRASAWIRG